MRIIILGLGKVGSQIQHICAETGIEVKCTVSPNNPLATYKSITQAPIEPGDTVIDFSNPEAVLVNATHIAAQGGNIVMGTTGWEKDRKQMEALIAKSKIGFAYTPNYAPEVHIFWELVKSTAQKLSATNSDNFRAYVFENRFYKKKSASGTARKTASILQNQKQLIFEEKDNFLVTLSGNKPMDIAVEFSSESDNIKLHFESLDAARNTTTYAEMALKTANWLQGKHGFFELTSAMIEEIKTKALPIS